MPSDSNSSSSPNCTVCIASYKLTYMPNNAIRFAFFGFFVVVVAASLIGNVAAIYHTSKRPFRFFQKACIVSLAMADIFTTVVLGLNNLATFSNPLTTWVLGEFFCKFIPMGQMAGVVSTAIILMCIALDRYRNIVKALNTTYTPKPVASIAIFLLIAILSLVLGVPMLYFFDHMPLVVYDNSTVNGHTVFNYKNLHTCVTFDKVGLRRYYFAMMLIIFLPLAVVFIAFYYKIALLIWKHRRPASSSHRSPSEKVRVERKIRTFKIMVLLILVFIFLRLPFYVVWLIKLAVPNSKIGSWLFYLSYVSSGLHVLNCALNPLLYTFLTRTIGFFHKLFKVLFWDLCFCFCSKSDFDEFEKNGGNDRPFVVCGQRDSRVKFEEDVKEFGESDDVSTKPLKRF